MAVEFDDPVTDVSYDPIGDPVGTAMSAVAIVGGLTMTLLLFTIAQGTVLPVVQDVVSSLTGGAVESDSDMEVFE